MSYRAKSYKSMRLLKQNALLSLANSYVIDSPQPSSLSYMWNFGSLLALCLGMQIITGILAAMHYNPSVDLAFISVEHLMRDVNSGWLLRYLHANGASAFFIAVYFHVARGMYYGSYKGPRMDTWFIGVVILILMMATAFLGYVLPFGQMSLWGATVITSMLSAIPWLGNSLTEFIWGGFSVSNATVNRFFALHYLLPFVLAALAAVHMITLHSNGSGNPLGITANSDRIAMHPYFIFKDLVTIIAGFLVMALLVFYAPNMLGHSDNYIQANPMQTPPSIVPEWYLTFAYAILRSIPNKLLGVLGMLSCMLILLLLPILDTSRLRGSQFRPLFKLAFWFFVADFFLLTWLGMCHAEEPFITIGIICSVFYFAYFLIIIPVIGIVENSMADIGVLDANADTTLAPNTTVKMTAALSNKYSPSRMGNNLVILHK